MIPLFLGLTAANLILLSAVFVIGLMTPGVEKPTWLYPYHLSLGIAAGLVTLAAHLAVYMYFMATARWLQAATDKANLNPQHFAAPALLGKRRVLPFVMGAIVAVMLTMFAGAGADPTLRPWWPGEVHLIVGAIAIVANALCALVEFKMIKEQGRLMDAALALLNRTPGVVVQS